MFRRIVNLVEFVALAGAGVFIVMLFAAHSGTGIAYNPAGGPVSGSGAQVFAANCARCHGAHGEGGIGPQLAGRVIGDFPDPQAQIERVRNGRGGMPSFRDTLTDQQINQVVEYTRTLK